MPVHDWTRVEAGIFHDFHHEWISTIRRALNAGLLPPDYYALAEQQAAGFGPDILTLQMAPPATEPLRNGPSETTPGGVVLAPPRVRFTAQTKGEFYRRKTSVIVIRHVTDDRIVAVVEIISPGNKAGRNAFNALIDKACELLENNIHLLLVDLFPPTKRDPQGLHAALWEEMTNEQFVPPADKPLTLAASEAGPGVTAYVEPFAVGDALPDMPLFLEPGCHIPLPLNPTYEAAFDAVPQRWRRVLEAAPV